MKKHHNDNLILLLAIIIFYSFLHLTGMGYRGPTQLSVTVENGSISDITIDSYVDDGKYFNRAYPIVIESIIANQSVDVDIVSGATFSSNSIKDAVADALGLGQE